MGLPGAGGTYFVTFCTSAHRPVLSSIRRGRPLWSPAPRSHPAGGMCGRVHRAYRSTGGAPGYHAQPCPSAPDAGTGGHKGRPYRGRDAGRRKDCPRRRPNASSRKDCPHRSRDAGRHKNCPRRRPNASSRKDCPHRSRDAGGRKGCPTDSGPRAAAELGRLVGGVKSRSVHLAAGRGLRPAAFGGGATTTILSAVKTTFCASGPILTTTPCAGSWIATTQRDRTGETLCRQRPRP